MKVIDARNVHQAIPQALSLLASYGESRNSRNGAVQIAPWPVTTVYRRPAERIPFYDVRDINTAFLVYEALWMLAGRNDVKPLLRYVKRMAEYSDDGETFHGAYGYRWRKHFGRLINDYSTVPPIYGDGEDQIPTIIARLKADPTDRRSVLQMWDPIEDLDAASKDLPCNTAATFQRGRDGALNMVVFNRSNDIVWGAYFANAFHFSLLLDYMANAIGCEMGTYTQVSVNWHAYEATLNLFSSIPLVASAYTTSDPYQQNQVRPTRFTGSVERVDALIDALLDDADTDFSMGSDGPEGEEAPWARAAYAVLHAHHLYRTNTGPTRYEFALGALKYEDQTNDWIASMTTWLQRRAAKTVTV